jgi:hypothetical protein
LWHFAESPQEDYDHAADKTSMPFCSAAGSWKERQRRGVVCFVPVVSNFIGKPDK